MNKIRRAELRKAIDLLSQAKDIIEMCRDEEQDAFDNLPESFQEGEKGEAMESYIYEMEEAMDEIDDTIDSLEGDVIDA